MNEGGGLKWLGSLEAGPLLISGLFDEAGWFVDVFMFSETTLFDIWSLCFDMVLVSRPIWSATAHHEKRRESEPREKRQTYESSATPGYAHQWRGARSEKPIRVLISDHIYRTCVNDLKPWWMCQRTSVDGLAELYMAFRPVYSWYMANHGWSDHNGLSSIGTVYKQLQLFS